MFFCIKKYIQFILKSTNQHGVHSPFVYQLVTQCFYTTRKNNSQHNITALCNQYVKKKKIKPRIAKIMNRIPNYLGIKTGVILSKYHDFIFKIITLNNTIEIDRNSTTRKKYDLIYVDINYIAKKDALEKLLSKMHNDSVLILSSIYQSESTVALWKSIVNTKKITITIDTFYLGFIFIRKEQVKEHFIIRI